MKAFIISIGEELLIGQTINTNAAWISRKLNTLGIEVAEITAITDDNDEILRSLRNYSRRADLILITGGLGPTRDDVTKHALCTYFDTKLVLSKDILLDVENYLTRQGRTMNELNHLQAMVPEKADLLSNPYGTAPGLWFRQETLSVVAMPGVPHEMKEMMEHKILPVLKDLPREQYIIHKSILTQGIGESNLAEFLSDWEDQLPDCIQLAYLPSMGIVKLRLTGKGPDEKEIIEAINKEISKLKNILSKHIWGFDGDTPESVAGRLLSGNSLSVATAESCTGGYLAHRITSVPGSSRYFKGSVVAYDNSIKTKILGVNKKDISQYGAVSKEVAVQMATSVKQLMNADYGIGITGIAGPDGGSEEKPAGTTWISVAGMQKTITRRFNLADNRERNIIRATKNALMMLILLTEEEDSLS